MAPPSGRPDPANPVLRSISREDRRKVLEALLAAAPRSEGELAERLVAAGVGRSVPGSTDLEAVRSTLTHVHLPALSAAGLVAWDRDEGSVEPTTHPALDDARFGRLLALDVDGLDDALFGLSDERRRIVLTALRDERRSMSRTALASAVLRRWGRGDDPDAAALDAVGISLHHVHLPKLSELGLLEYDPDTGRATYTAHAALEAVFDVIYEPDADVVDRYDGFLQGLCDSYAEASQDRRHPTGWPHFWREYHHG